jgi:MFS family permease
MAVSIGIDPRPLGFLLSLVAVAQTAVFLLAGLTSRWQYKMAPLLVAQGFAFLGTLFMGFGSSVIILGFGLAFIGLLVGISFCSSCFYSLFTSSRGGARAGWHEAIVGSGMLFGPFLGGLSAQYFGMRTPYFLCAALVVVATCVQGYIRYTEGQKPEERRRRPEARGRKPEET